MATFLTGLRLPEEVERGALGGPRFNTTVLVLDSGFEKRNANWVDTRGEWDLGYGMLNKFQEDQTSAELDLNELIRIFYVVQAKRFSFRFKDWSDYEIGMENGVDETSPQLIQLGDDATTVIPVFKRYSHADTSSTFDRTLTKLVGSTVRVYLDGVLQTLTTHYTVDEDRATITMVTPPASTGGTGPGGEEQVQIRCEFDCHVRFDTDALDINMEMFGAGSWPSFPVIELRANGLD